MDINFEEYNKHIGSVIKKNRKKKNIPQSDLAKMLKVNTSTVSRYERGQLDIPASCLEAISDEYNFTPLEYFHNKKNPYRIIEKIAENMSIDFNAELLKQNLPPLEDEYIQTSKEVLEDLRYLEALSTRNKNVSTQRMFDYVIGNIIVEYSNSQEADCRLSMYCKALLKMTQKNHK